MPEGNRDNALFDKGRNDFHQFMPEITNGITTDEIEARMEEARGTFANYLVRWDAVQCVPPLGEEYVREKAAYMWEKGMNGTLFPDGHQIIGVPVDASFDSLTRDHPRAFAVEAQLRRKYRFLVPFTCPSNRAKPDFGMDAKTLRQCLRVLEQHDKIARLHKGGRYSPAVAKANPRLPNRGDVAWYVLLPMATSKAS